MKIFSLKTQEAKQKQIASLLNRTPDYLKIGPSMFKSDEEHKVASAGANERVEQKVDDCVSLY